jgi:hypothetical protein
VSSRVGSGDRQLSLGRPRSARANPRFSSGAYALRCGAVFPRAQNRSAA